LCNKKPWNKLEACGEICCVHGGPNSGVRAWHLERTVSEREHHTRLRHNKTNNTLRTYDFNQKLQLIVILAKLTILFEIPGIR
jgi:hypothetical protein